MAMAFAEKEGGKKKNVRSGGLGDLTRLLGEGGANENSSGGGGGGRSGGNRGSRK